MSVEAGSSKIKILFLGANPSNTTHLALGKEAREIMERLRAAHQGSQFEFVQEWAVRVGDLQAALLRHRPHIVHFSGHGRGEGDAFSRSGPASDPNRDMLSDGVYAGDNDGEILVEDDVTGKARPLPAPALAKLFKLVRGIRCVVLNACHSVSQADAICEHVDAVISMRRTIRDDAAVHFAWAFYQGLGFGESLDNAFELGKNQIELAGFDDSEVPQFLTRETRESVRPIAPGSGDSTPPPAPKIPTWRPVELGEADGHFDPFLLRVERITQLRHPRARLRRLQAPAPFAGVLEVEMDVGGFFRVSIVGALNQAMTEELAALFSVEIDQRVRRRHPQLRSTLVHQGYAAPLELRARLDREGIELQAFDSYQGLFDVQPYLQWQSRELEKNPAYLASVYVDPPAWIKVAGSRELQHTDNALLTLSELLVAQHRRFLLVLGEFGAGKTFLLRELCRYMVQTNHPVVPVLLEMSKLEKQHSLAELLGAHFARADVPGYNFKAFEYMLGEGRIALFFDGFDELADKVTYDSATQHLDTVLSAVHGQAKVVLSSRRQHFLTEGDIHRAVEREFARKAESAVQGGYRLIMLEPFAEPQIRRYLRNALGDEVASEARYRLLDEVKDLIGLSHNPRMLSFIAGIPEESLREAKEQWGEITAAKLYEILVDQWLDFEHTRSRRQGSSMRLSRRALLRGVESLALSLWQTRTKTILASEIHERIGQALVALGEPALDPAILTFVFGSGSLLVRDEDGRFSFVHRSVMEWLVAKQAADDLSSGRDPQALVVDEMSALMADFFAAMAGRERAVTWAREKLTAVEEVILRKNATLLLTRMGERFERVNFEGQDLRGKDFSGVDWRGANLRGADLHRAVLKGANLRGTSLVRANLSHADLRGADLRDADLTGADLSFVRAQGAEFWGATGFQSDQLCAANLLGAKGISEQAYEDLRAAGAVPPVLRGVEPMYATGSACLSLAWSPVGSMLAIAHEDSVVSLVDAAAGNIVRVLSGHIGEVRCVAFSPDGKLVASGSKDRTIRMWQVSTGQLCQVFAFHKAPVHCVAFSPDGKMLVSGSLDKRMILWSATSGKVLHIYDEHASSVHGVAFSPNGKTLVSGSNDNVIRLWDFTKRLVLRKFLGHTAAVLSVAFSPDGKLLASGSSDTTVKVWDVETGALQHSVDKHNDDVYSVAFAPDGKSLASTSHDRTVLVSNVATGHVLRVFEGHLLKVRGAAFSPDGGTLASGSEDKTVRLWDVETGRLQRVLEGHAPYIAAVAFAPHGRTLATAGHDKTVRIWDLAAGSAPQIIGGHARAVGCVAFAPNGTILASGSGDKTIRLWDMPSGRLLRILEGHAEAVFCIAFAPDGKTIASGSSDMLVRHWDVVSRTQRILRGHTMSVNSVAFSPDRKYLASGSSDKTIRLWDADLGRLLRTFDSQVSAVLSISFSPDSKLLASAQYDNTIKLWETATGRALRTYGGHIAAVRSVAFAPDGKTFVTSSTDNTIRLWSITTGQTVRVFEGHLSNVLSIAFSPDGQTIASGSYDNTVRLWDVASGQCRAILLATPEGWVAFTPDGRYKYGGNIAGSFWHVAGLCRFEPGELDDYLNLRLPDDAPFLPDTPITK